GLNTTSGGTNANSDEATTLNLTYAALAISIGAFVLSTLQALLAYLQFDNSELGRRRCSAEVMGALWASKTTRKFKWREWRYQVFFEVPVFYTAPPGQEPSSSTAFDPTLMPNMTPNRIRPSKTKRFPRWSLKSRNMLNRFTRLLEQKNLTGKQ
ncbi:hypothetical protein DH86_00003413, partial [Scytalidium sp. 3C]